MRKIYLIFFIIMITALSGILGGFAYILISSEEPATVIEPEPSILKITKYTVASRGMFRNVLLSATSFRTTLMGSDGYSSVSFRVKFETNISFDSEIYQLQFRVKRGRTIYAGGIQVQIYNPIIIYDETKGWREFGIWFNVTDGDFPTSFICTVAFPVYEWGDEQFFFNIRLIAK